MLTIIQRLLKQALNANLGNSEVEGVLVNEKAPNLLKVKGFCGPDGTRTRDLRRDRAAF